MLLSNNTVQHPLLGSLSLEYNNISFHSAGPINRVLADWLMDHIDHN